MSQIEMSDCDAYISRDDPSKLQEIRSASIIVGTSCAATGLDIDSVKHVVVVGLPYSIEQLLQWAGRCRSDGTVIVIIPTWQMKQDTELSRKFGLRHACI